MTRQEEAERFAKEAPPLSQAERDAINDLFPAYIFRRSCTNEIWTTCCRRHMTVRDEDMMVTTPERNFLAVMWEPHQREPKNRSQNPPEPAVQCPLCGRMVIVKELGRTGGPGQSEPVPAGGSFSVVPGSTVGKGLRLRQALQQKQGVQPHM